MRRHLVAVTLAFALWAAAPAQAQLRANLPEERPVVAVTDTPTGLSLGSLLNPDHFRIGHSYEFSYSSFGGGGVGLGVYTTSLQFQPTHRLAARVDVGVAHSPFGSDGIQSQLGFSPDQPARVFLQNAEVAYRPSENTTIHLQFRQSPYGSYASPYGYYSPYGYGPYGGHAFSTRISTADDLFWRTSGQ